MTVVLANTPSWIEGFLAWHESEFDWIRNFIQDPTQNTIHTTVSERPIAISLRFVKPTYSGTAVVRATCSQEHSDALRDASHSSHWVATKLHMQLPLR